MKELIQNKQLKITRQGELLCFDLNENKKNHVNKESVLNSKMCYLREISLFIHKVCNCQEQ